MPAFAFFYPVKDLSEAGNAFLSEARDENEGRAEKYQQAINFFEEAYAREPDNIIVIYNLANAYHYQGKYSQAIELYQVAIDLGIKENHRKILADLYYNQGNTYYKKEDFGKALESYKLAMEQDDQDIQIKKNYELAFNKLQENKNSQPNPAAPNDFQKSPQDNNQNNQEEQSRQQGSSQSSPSDNLNSPNPDSQKGNGSDQKNNDSTSSTANPGGNASPNSTISFERAEQILNSYQNRQKRFESFRKYNQRLSTKPNSKNW